MNPRPSIALVMIVKNESAVIKRCLDSVLPFIDRWAIVDTGSTDGTQALVRSLLEDVPGELFERPWVDFGHNRTESVRLAGTEADYLLLIDADMTLEGEPQELAELTADSYHVKHAGPMAYWNLRLARSNLPWRYVGSTHEALHCPTPTTQGRLTGLEIVHHADGGARSDKFERDLKLLNADVARDPDNARSRFYLAQTLKDLDRPTEAVTAYRKRAEMGGWEEEVYYSLFQIGLITTDRLDEWPKGLAAFLSAWESRPSRLEALYEAVRRLNQRKQHRTALALATAGLNTPVPDDLLFVTPAVYDVLLAIEWSVAAYWTGDGVGCVSMCDKLLRWSDLSPDLEQLIRGNRAFGLELTSGV